MGKISAYGAFVFGALFLALTALQVSWGLGLQPLILAAVGLALLVGAYRTLRKQSGGLRLLAGAWGVAAGLLLQPLTFDSAPLEGTYALPLGVVAAVLVIAPYLALVGLALTVLHKEQKG
jgi:hypothetical protein